MSVACTPLGTVTAGSLGLCKPTIGETGWGTAMNGNLDAIDANVVRSLDRLVTIAEAVNTVAEIVVYTFSVPGGILGTNRALRLTVIGDYLNASEVNPVFTMKVKYGGVVLIVGIATLAVQAGQRRAIRAVVTLSAQNATNAQVSDGLMQWSQANGAGAPPVPTLAATHWQQVNNAVGVDSTVGQNIEVTYQHSAAAADVSARLLAARLELIP